MSCPLCGTRNRTYHKKHSARMGRREETETSPRTGGHPDNMYLTLAKETEATTFTPHQTTCYSLTNGSATADIDDTYHRQQFSGRATNNLLFEPFFMLIFHRCNSDLQDLLYYFSYYRLYQFSGLFKHKIPKPYFE